jgi:hypothetical protein
LNEIKKRGSGLGGVPWQFLIVCFKIDSVLVHGIRAYLRTCYLFRGIMTESEQKKDQDPSGEVTLLQTLKENLLTQQTSTLPVEVPVNPIFVPTVKFNGTNYSLWLSMMETHLTDKGKLGYV